jgi:hypothetical protein
MHSKIVHTHIYIYVYTYIHMYTYMYVWIHYVSIRETQYNLTQKQKVDSPFENQLMQSTKFTDLKKKQQNIISMESVKVFDNI